jgi:hypothetical protein
MYEMTQFRVKIVGICQYLTLKVNPELRHYLAYILGCQWWKY